MKDDYEDIPGYCVALKCEQGVKATDKEIIDIFHVKQSKKDIVFILDNDGILYYLNQTKDAFELVEQEYKDIINVYNLSDSNTIRAIDIKGNTYYINLAN